jgi:hypothetical protein
MQEYFVFHIYIYLIFDLCLKTYFFYKIDLFLMENFVVIKLSKKVEGRQREAIFRKGEWHDLYSVAILKREFDALPTASEFINAVCPKVCLNCLCEL